LRDTVIKFGAATVVDARGEPGTVLAAGEAGITVACGEAALQVSALQRPGSKRMPAGEFLRGFPVTAGERFAAAVSG
jgi:methionyl-tRNA formyltransferase